MAQASWRPLNAAVDDGSILALLLNDIIPALLSTQEGAAPPPSPVRGALWADSVSASQIVLRIYDGSTYRALLLVNTATGEITLATPPPAEFPSGTRMLFQQSTAPTGWVKDTSINDRTLRVTSGSVVAGGSLPFSSVFRSQAVTGAVQSHTLSWNEMPWHNHGIPGGNFAYVNTGTFFVFPVNGDGGNFIGYGQIGVDGAGGNWGHAHAFAGDSINLNIQFVDVIIAQKS
jgi:hypothetical protein